MRYILTQGVLFLIVVVIVGCKKEEPLTPAQKIEGKWTITSQEILTTVVPGDGSYLEFNGCSSSCSGIDFKMSDTTNGTFTYVLNEEGTIITINDQTADGGNWNATWDILELTETDFRITSSTILGNLKVEMTKAM